MHKNFKELDEEMCGLLKLVNHGNARKACLEKKKIQILVIIDYQPDIDSELEQNSAILLTTKPKKKKK